MTPSRFPRPLVALLALALAWPGVGAPDEHGPGSANSVGPAIRAGSRTVGVKRPKLLHHRLKIAAADPIDELDDDADEAPAPSLKKAVPVADPLRLHSFDRLPAPPNRGLSRPTSLPPTRHLRC